MEILFVTSELAPFSFATDAAEVAAALPKALRGLGHKVTVVSPLYAGIDPTARSLARRLSTFSVEAMGRNHSCTVFDGRTTGGVDLIFLANAELFGERGPGIGSTEQQLLAAAVFGGAVAQLMTKREPSFELVHAHGGLAGLSLVQCRALLPELPRVLSIHDVAADLHPSAAELEKLGLPGVLREALSEGSALTAAARAADLVIANAPSTARAWTSDTSSPLASCLHAKGDRLVGIVNGVDASLWNPLTDSNLTARFDPIEMSGKGRCKAALQFELGLAVQATTPLFAVIGELSAANGGDLIVEAAPQLLRNPLQLLVLTHDDAAAKALQGIATDMPERMALRTTFTEKERHLALAGADFLVLPARQPVATDLALCALRYGTLPLVCPVGALADMIVDTDAKLETGNGFVAQEPSVTDVVASAARAVASYEQGESFDALRRRVMRTDVSWERAARRYEYMYRQLKTARQSAA